MKNIAVIGSTGAIGRAMVGQLQQKYPSAQLHLLSKAGLGNAEPMVFAHRVDIIDEESIKAAAFRIDEPLDFVFVATGLLQNEQIKPEKSLRDLSSENFERLFQINTIGPALVAKYFLPKLNRNSRSVFAVLSARVGSIADNRLGGWYAYRASKAALNMIVKNASIEIARKNKQAIVVSLHPGTVDSLLSKPFQSNVPDGKLFSPEFSAGKLLSVVDNLSPDQSGGIVGWDGEPIPF